MTKLNQDPIKVKIEVDRRELDETLKVAKELCRTLKRANSLMKELTHSDSSISVMGIGIIQQDENQ